MREEQRVSKNLLGSVGPGGFSGGFVCMRTVFYLKKKILPPETFHQGVQPFLSCSTNSPWFRKQSWKRC